VSFIIVLINDHSTIPQGNTRFLIKVKQIEYSTVIAVIKLFGP